MLIYLFIGILIIITTKVKGIIADELPDKNNNVRITNFNYDINDDTDADVNGSLFTFKLNASVAGNLRLGCQSDDNDQMQKQIKRKRNINKSRLSINNLLRKSKRQTNRIKKDILNELKSLFLNILKPEIVKNLVNVDGKRDIAINGDVDSSNKLEAGQPSLFSLTINPPVPRTPINMNYSGKCLNKVEKWCNIITSSEQVTELPIMETTTDSTCGPTQVPDQDRYKFKWCGPMGTPGFETPLQPCQTTPYPICFTTDFTPCATFQPIKISCEILTTEPCVKSKTHGNGNRKSKKPSLLKQLTKCTKYPKINNLSNENQFKQIRKEILNKNASVAPMIPIGPLLIPSKDIPNAFYILMKRSADNNSKNSSENINDDFVAVGPIMKGESY